MDDEERDWLNNFLRINAVGRKPARPELMSSPRRKDAHRLDGILKADKLAVIITNRRARAGIRQTKFSR